MSDFYADRDDDELIKTIHYAIELCVNFLDTVAPFTLGEDVFTMICMQLAKMKN